MAKLFIDIETMPSSGAFLSKEMTALFAKKYCKEDDVVGEVFDKTAGLYAEFGEIVCISLGKEDEHGGIIKSFAGDDEKKILQNFCDFIGKGQHTRVGHNIKSFDLPFIVKRLWMHSMPIPPSLNFEGLKPREVKVEDTMEMRRGLGQYTNNSSLELICLCLGIPNPKASGDGSNVADLAEDGRYTDIMTYCEGDVEATMKIYKRIHFIS